MPVQHVPVYPELLTVEMREDYTLTLTINIRTYTQACIFNNIILVHVNETLLVAVYAYTYIYTTYLCQSNVIIIIRK